MLREVKLIQSDLFLFNSNFSVLLNMYFFQLKAFNSFLLIYVVKLTSISGFCLLIIFGRSYFLSPYKGFSLVS